MQLNKVVCPKDNRHSTKSHRGVTPRCVSFSTARPQLGEHRTTHKNPVDKIISKTAISNGTHNCEKIPTISYGNTNRRKPYTDYYHAVKTELLVQTNCPYLPVDTSEKLWPPKTENEGENGVNMKNRRSPSQDSLYPPRRGELSLSPPET